MLSSSRGREDPRLAWVYTQVADSLSLRGPEVVSDYARRHKKTDRLMEWLNGEGPSTLLFYYQGQEVMHEGKPRYVGSPELFLTDGAKVGLGGKGVYLLRNRKVQTSTADQDVIVGGLEPNILSSLQSHLRDVMIPTLDRQTAWGDITASAADSAAHHAQHSSSVDDNADPASAAAAAAAFVPPPSSRPRPVQALLEGASRLRNTLGEAIASMEDSVELKMPDPPLHIDSRPVALAKAATDAATVKTCEETLEAWCKQIEQLLAESEQVRQEADDVGPHAELEHWKSRMAKFNTITEQLKKPECKTVLGILTAAKSRVLKAWKTLDIRITDAANEAKDNVKYLYTLERFSEPLYKADPVQMIDAIPSLINAIRMMHSIARFYNTSERLTALFVKITNQMISCCRTYLSTDENGLECTIWDQPRSVVIKKLRACADLNEAYQSTYRATKVKLQTTPKEKQFNFSEMYIFGKFDLFTKRIQKLIDMISTIDQFSTLEQAHIEGLDPIVRRFKQIVGSMQRKPYNLLDHRRGEFEADYLDFIKSIMELETTLRSFVNDCFATITDTQRALDLLESFKSVLSREGLRAELESKYMVIFTNYGRDLEMVRRLYEKHKEDPPIQRNLPPVAGNIAWSRQLLRRIEAPMALFQQYPHIMQTPEARKIIRTYNKLAAALVEFETLWHHGWTNSIESARSGLAATLLVRHPSTKRLYVNFDPQILQLIRETRWMSHLGLSMPESAKFICVQEAKYKDYQARLGHMLKEHHRVLTGKISPLLRRLMRSHIEDLNARLEPGLTTLTWTSLNIDSYLSSVHDSLARLEEIASKANDILTCRIEENMRAILAINMITLPETFESMSVRAVVEHVQKTAQAQARTIDSRSLGIETAVNDLIAVVTAGFNPAQSAAISEDCTHLVAHFRRMTYEALLKCIKSSLVHLKKRLGGHAQATTINNALGTAAGVFGPGAPFFKVDLELAIPDVIMSPDLDELQYSLSQMAVALLQSCHYIYQWGQDRAPAADGAAAEAVAAAASAPLADLPAVAAAAAPDSGLVSFFPAVSKDKDIVKTCLLLTGAITGLRQQVYLYLESFRKYAYLWKDNKDDAFEAFIRTNPDIDAFEAELRRYEDLEKEIDSLPQAHVVGALSLDSTSLKYSLRSEAAAWKQQYGAQLKNKAFDDMNSLTALMEETTVKLHRKVTDLDDVRQTMEVLAGLRDLENEVDQRIAPIEETYALLIKYNVRVSRDEMDRVDNLPSSWRKLKQLASSVKDHLTELQPGFKQDLVRSVGEFRKDVDAFYQDYQSKGPMVQGIKPAQAIDRLRTFTRAFEERDRKWVTYSVGERLFGLPVTEYPRLDTMRREISLNNRLYNLYSDVIMTVNGYEDILWSDLDFESITTQIGEFQVKCHKLPRAMREWEAYLELKKTIDDFSELMPLLSKLSNKAIRPRHWTQIMTLTKHTFKLDPESFKLKNLLEAPLLKHMEDIEDICNAAVKEADIETKLRGIEDDWIDSEFTFASFKARGELTLKGSDTQEIVTVLEDSLMALNSLMSNRYNAPFKKEIVLWVSKLSTTSEVIEQWLAVQALWVYLEAVFAGGDIARQLPKEAKRFAAIDKSWVKIMTSARDNPNVIQCCYGDEVLRNLLPHITEQLELCQKSLSGYLERKRQLFPRFYFVSDPVLLEILGQSSDPHSIQVHLKSVFDNVARLEFDRASRNKVIGMYSSEGEHVALSNPFLAEGGVENWLNLMVEEMRNSLKDVVREVASKIHAPNFSLEQFIKSYQAQPCLLGMQLQWTYQCEDGLSKARTERGIMNATNRKLGDILRTMVEFTTRDLDKLSRTKIETLITIQVHQRDVFDALVKGHVRAPADFEWQKQTRFYWRPDKDDCIVSITDVDFPYQYEYLGCTERLVITPLTDRCYITLAQAIGLCLGGAPAGPAGTGKTETVKDMGKALGKLVVVFNCSDQMDYRGLGRIFKGVAQSGCWGDFDEFNRIELEVLSVAAQQIACISNAKKERKDRFIFTDGETVNLNSQCGLFITMNPGYAGRQELPENMKLQFRNVAMMVPDRQIIMRVKLASQGFQDSIVLAQKFFILYRLCEEQLSKQRHYDFGLRNILSVLRTCGNVKRANPHDSETMIMMRVLRDMNLSKLVDEDEALFRSLIDDLFPNINAQKAAFPAIERAIAKEVEAAGLVNHPDWILKILQLYETSRVRHGIMVLGPSGAGKTTCIRTLLNALTECGEPHKEFRMNPKAITAPQMFGRLDVATNDWTDGIFSALWRRACKKKNSEYTWITLDGPVDAIWIENLNTVLDDNRQLSLANGDRIPMHPNLKLVFEVSSLENASPATVSRAGMIYMSATSLGWKPVLEAWLKKLPASIAGPLKTLFHNHVGKLFDFIREHTEPKMDTSQVHQITTTMALLQGLLPAGVRPSSAGPSGNGGAGNEGLNVPANTVPDDQSVSGASTATNDTPSAAPTPQPDNADVSVSEAHLERLFIFAAVWGIGGLLEQEDRVRVHQWMEGAGLGVPSTGSSPTGVDEGSEGVEVSADDEITVYEYLVDSDSGEWIPWKTRVKKFEYPETGKAPFYSLLIPTVDSVRMEFLIDLCQRGGKSVMLIGAPGTAKTSIINSYLGKQDTEQVLSKTINFSSATTPNIFQRTVEGFVERRIGNTYGPSANKRMLCFIDDINMPEINEWGDQITNEIVRQLIEMKFFYNLEKPGDVSNIVDVSFLAAMCHPGGGRNPIPERLKRHFAIFNTVIPSRTSLTTIFGTIVRGHFSEGRGFAPEIRTCAEGLVEATRRLWSLTKGKMLPTPSKFHYVFNLRDLSRIFEGLSLSDSTVVQSTVDLLRLWRHECQRVIPDKFNTPEDKRWFEAAVREVLVTEHDPDVVEKVMGGDPWFVDFLRDPPDPSEMDDPDAEIETPKIYEPIVGFRELSERLHFYMGQYNEMKRGQGLDLVLFDDALRHLMKISRIIRFPRGNALLVGVGGSGKQSLTRLASYIAGYDTFQITVTRTYNENNLMDDLRHLYRVTGASNRGVTFIFTDSEIVEEGFLEHINNILTSGEVANLFPRDEMDAILTDLRPVFKKERKDLVDTNEALYKFFIERVRNNLHVVLCFSPVGDKFRSRALKFPGLISGCTIDWFTPWPRDALLAVADKYISEFDMVSTPETRSALVEHMADVHDGVTKATGQYFARYRRNTYVTPKSYMSFLKSYKEVYSRKRSEIGELSQRMRMGLEKLNQASVDVAKLRVDLVEKEKELEKAQSAASEFVVEITQSTTEAEAKRAEVQKTKEDLQEGARKIQKEKQAAERDLEAARPALEEAENALNQIKPSDISTLKRLAKPPNLIKRLMDGVLLLRKYPVDKVVADPEFTDRIQIRASWESAQKMMTESDFLQALMQFPKETINDETCELLAPYLAMSDFNTPAAKSVSANVAGVCTWIRAMVEYHEIAKDVAPKVEALRVAESRLKVAGAALEASEAELAEMQKIVDELQARYNEALRRKQGLQDDADLCRKRLSAAAALIDGLAGEKERWTQQCAEFDETLVRLVGDVALATAFLSYAGPFNQEFRNMLLRDNWRAGLTRRGVPVSADLTITKFLADEATVGDWNLQGLPTDELSTQNGIIVTSATRYPLLIDPQGQGKTWIKNREAENLLVVTTLNDKNFRNALEDCLSFGKPLLVEDVEEELDPVLDPVLEKELIKSGRGWKVRVGDKEVDFCEGFRLYMTTKLANPHYSPEVSAKTSIIDMTVTMQGLEDQLLGRVILKEKAELERQLTRLLEDVNQSRRTINALEESLLKRLTSTTGNLLDDDTLIEVLANTKATTQEVNEKLTISTDTEKKIKAAREEFRPVATRGSILYFLIAEMSFVNHMYQTSLSQFLGLFDDSMDNADASPVTSKRIANIIEYATYHVYCYVTRGLFENDKVLFTLQLALKIGMNNGSIDAPMYNVLIKGGAALDLNAVRKKPFAWVPDVSWLNLVALSDLPLFETILYSIEHNEAKWRAWYELEAPERSELPDGYDGRLDAFGRLLLVRCWCQDRTMLAATSYILEALGERYVEGTTLDLQATVDEADCRTPLVCLLSVGSDPSSQIAALAKKLKIELHEISMGQGQEVHARRLIAQGIANGSWVLLQNCHLGLKFLDELVSTLNATETIAERFRVWITTDPINKFPINLLQTSIKLTNEPPQGVRAGLKRTYAWVTQDMLDAIDRPQWKNILYTLCFLHTTVQERRKFGPLGWNIPYEFNMSDLSASVAFLQNHLYELDPRKGINWNTVRYMICEVQYGGRITDDYDRRLMNAYGTQWLSDALFQAKTQFYEGYPLPEARNIKDIRAFIDTLPLVDSPEIFGLHPNADITYRTHQAQAVLGTILNIQPKEGAGVGGETREDAVLRVVNDLLSKLPPDFVKSQVKSRIRRMNSGSNGTPKPLEIFLGQEIDRIQIVIATVRRTLEDLRLAIAGTIIMSPALSTSLNALYDARVPPDWERVSWPSPTLGFWFGEVLGRCQQYQSWLADGRPAAFWLSGFFNPQGFLTAVRQEISRAHQGWALDTVKITTEVTKLEKEDVKASPDEGCYIWGLSMDGASFDKRSGVIVESKPKALVHGMPVIKIGATNGVMEGSLVASGGDKGGKGGKDGGAGGAGGMSEYYYQCPVYSRPERTDRTYVFDLAIRTSQPPDHWTQRGVACLLSKN